MKVASGGELARFLLALKVSLAERGTAPTLVFDEIDTGVGGAVADAIGQRLARLAAKAQVLAVTHAPQVAARSQQHFRIVKNDVGKGERVATQRAVARFGGAPRGDRSHAGGRGNHRRGAGCGQEPDRESGLTGARGVLACPADPGGLSSALLAEDARLSGDMAGRDDEQRRRQERLAAALRENLKRRKAQQRGRRAGDESPPPPRESNEPRNP